MIDAVVVLPLLLFFREGRAIWPTISGLFPASLSLSASSSTSGLAPNFCQLQQDIDIVHEQEMSSPRSVAVVGSLNIDFVTRTLRLPHPGETLQAISFDTGFGGKGANQAVGAARLAGEGVKVRMVGAIGDDGFGNDYFEALGKEGIDTSGVRRLKGEKTGITNIVVDSSGENRIMFIANANMSFKDGEDLVSSQEGDVVVFQLEIPFKTVSRSLSLATNIVAC